MSAPADRKRTHPARARRRRARWKWGLLVAVVIALGAAAKPVYHRLKSGRAAQIASEGDRLARDGDAKNAAAKYRAALQLDPINLPALEGAARLAEQLGRPEALDLWQQVLLHGGDTVDARQHCSNLALQLGKMDVARREIERLVRTDPDATTLDLAARFFAQEGSGRKAVEFARAAAKKAPENDALRFQLANLLAGSAAEADRAEARELLWSLAAAGTYRAVARQALGRSPELSPDEQARVLAMLREAPDATAVDGLLAADLEIKARPADAERIIDDAVARWNDGKPEDLLELTRWLNLHGQFARAATVLPLDRALASSPLLLAALDTMAGQGQWAQIDAVLARKELPIDPTVAESFRARAARERAQPLEADLHWNRALAAAAGDPLKMQFVANFAAQSHDRQPAVRAYDQLAKFPEHAISAQRSLTQILGPGDDTVALLAATEKLAALQPDDPVVRDQRAYLNLLLRRDEAGAETTARGLVAKFPNRLAFRVTLALARLRRHDAADALAQFRGPAEIDWSKTPPAWRAVYAAVLAANDDEPRAREFAAQLPADQLKPEERELIAALTR